MRMHTFKKVTRWFEDPLVNVVDRTCFVASMRTHTPKRNWYEDFEDPLVKTTDR